MKMLSKIKFDKFFFSKKIVILFLVPILLMMLFYLFFFYPFINKSFLWRDINVEGLKIGNKSYDLENGILHKNGTERKLGFKFNPFELQENDEVLRLALFYQITKEDSLFVGPGLDKDKYKQSIEKLEKIHQELLNNAGFKENIIPINFLKKTAGVMEAQERFEKEKSLINAKNLIKQYKEVNNVYLKDATDLKNKLKSIDFTNKDLVQLGAVTSGDIILNDLDKIIKNHNFIEREIKKREMCLEFSSYFCKRPLKREETKNEVNNSNQTMEENIKILNNDELYYPKDPKDITLRGPYKISSPCWRKENKKSNSQYLYEMEEDISGMRRIFPKLATTNYYQRLSQGGDNEPLLNMQYKKHGLDWRIVFVTSSYGCNNIEFQPKLATINAYYERYKEKNILESLGVSGGMPNDYKILINAGKSAEETFFSEKFPSEESLDLVAYYYSKIYSFIITEQHKGTSEKWLKDLSSIKNELLIRQLFIEKRLADFDGVINFFSYLLDGYSQMFKLNKGDRESYIYYIRNGYALTYLGFSNSVWRSNESLQFIDNDKSKIRPDFKDYDELVQEYGTEYVSKINNIPRSQIWNELLGHFIE